MLRFHPRAVAIVAFTGVVAAGGAAGYLVSAGGPAVHAAASTTSPAQYAASPPSPLPAAVAALARCATAPRAELSAASLPGFKTATSGLIGHPLVHADSSAGIPVSDRPADYKDFVLGRGVGLVTAEAYSPAFLRQSQAYQKRMGYQMTDTPELPLQGQIVTAHPAGILEAYQLNTVYSEPAGAKSFQHLETSYPPGKVPGLAAITLPGALARDNAYRVDGATGQETGYYVNLIADGRIQVDFNFRGGPHVPLAAIARLVITGLGDLTSACRSAH